MKNFEMYIMTVWRNVEIKKLGNMGMRGWKMRNWGIWKRENEEIRK